MRFAWDRAKERANLVRHGVDFTTAQQAFADPKALVLFDAAHSNHRELRWWLLGKVDARILLVRYTHRPNGVIRLIGAGYGGKDATTMKTSGKTKSTKTPTFDAEGYQTNLTDLNRTPLPDLGKAKARPLSWGGARPGAGRKSSGRQPVLLRLTPATLRALRRTARAEGKTLSDLAEEKLAAR